MSIRKRQSSIHEYISEPAGRSSIGYTRDFCFVLWFRYNLSHTHPKSMAAPTKLPSMPTIGRRHLESQSREKGKLNFTCIWQGKAWQLLCTLLKHVLMLFCAINWKIQPFPEILPPFSSFFLIILDWHWFPFRNAMIYEEILLYWGCLHHINKTTCTSSSLDQYSFSSWYMARR